MSPLAAFLIMLHKVQYINLNSPRTSSCEVPPCYISILDSIEGDFQVKDIILITKEQIIKHIISLVVKKNDLDILILEKCDKCEETKIIIVDEENNFSNNLFDYTNSIILLTTKNLSDISKYSAIIKKPFLPKVIEKAILDNLSNIIKIPKESIEDDANDLVEYIDNLENENEDEDNQEVLIPKETLDKGGVLDTQELNELSKLVDDNIKTIEPEEKKEETNLDELSKIIDNAIEELKIENKEIKDEYKLNLNSFTFKELKPLLTKLDQKIIDKLVLGEKINLILEVKDDK